MQGSELGPVRLDVTDSKSSVDALSDAKKTNGVIAEVSRNARRSSVGIIFWVGGRFLAMLTVAAALDLESFGLFAVTTSLVMAVERTFNAQSWQLVSRFSAGTDGNVSEGRLASVFRTAVAYDLFGAAITITTVLVFARNFADALGISAVGISTIIAFSLISLCNSQGAMTGVLRATDQFWKYAAYQIVLGSGLLIAMLAAWLIAGVQDASTYLFIWLAVEASCFLLLGGFALVTIIRRHADARMDTSATRLGFAATWRFTGATLINSSLRMITKEWDVVLLSSVTGVTSAGAYKLGKQIATLPLLLTDQFYFAVFPKIAQLWSAGATNVVRSLIRKVSAWSFGGAALMLVGSFVVIALLRNIERLTEYALVLDFIQYCLPSVLVAFATFVFAPALTASGHHAWQTFSLLIASIFFFLSFFIAESFDLVAAMPIALFVYYFAWASAAATRLRQIGGL